MTGESGSPGPVGRRRTGLTAALLVALGGLGLSSGPPWSPTAVADLRPAAALSPAPAVTPTLSPPPATRPVALLHLRGGLRGTTVVDSSPARHSGRVVTGHGGRVESTGPGRDGYLRFPGRSCDATRGQEQGRQEQGCPWAVVLVRGRVAPERQGNAPFSFGAWVRMPREGGGTATAMTVMQHGGRDGGPSWSLRVDDGRVSCRWSDGATSVVLPDDLGRSFPLERSRWYALTCSRNGERFALSVQDPVTTWPLGQFGTERAGVGAIEPTGPVSVGAITGGGAVNTIAAPFHGDLDEVVFRTG